MFKTLFHILPCVLWFVLLVLYLKPLKLDRKWYLVCALILFAASQKFVIYLLFGRNSFNPELPGSFILAYSWLYSTANILCYITIAYCLLRSFLWFLRLCRIVPKPKTPLTIHGKRRNAVVLLIIACTISTYGLWEGIRIPRVKKYDVEFAELPAKFDGYKIVHLTDLHCSPATDRERFERIVDIVNSLSPDLICITGDFVDGAPKDRAADLAPLADLRAKDGVYGCAGNHEFYCDYSVWRPELTKLGIKMLDNEHTVISRGDDKITLAGLTDETSARYYRIVLRNFTKAFANSPKDSFRILMDHRPRNVLTHSKANIHLQLTGHTHGGAIFGMHWGVAKFNEGYVNGFYKIGNMTLYVSPGTGQWAGFPIRLVENSAITVLTLKRMPR